MAMCEYCKRVCDLPEWARKATAKEELYCESFSPAFIPTISMAYTSPSWVSCNKTVTRRNWKPITIKKFHKGTKFIAKRSNYGGQALGVGEITREVYRENTEVMGHNDYIAEGFRYMDNELGVIPNANTIYETGFPLLDAFTRWKQRAEIMIVVPFKIIEVFPGMEDKYTTPEEIKRCVKALQKAIG